MPSAVWKQCAQLNHFCPDTLSLGVNCGHAATFKQLLALVTCLHYRLDNGSVLKLLRYVYGVDRWCGLLTNPTTNPATEQTGTAEKLGRNPTFVCPGSWRHRLQRRDTNISQNLIYGSINFSKQRETKVSDVRPTSQNWTILIKSLNL